MSDFSEVKLSLDKTLKNSDLQSLTGNLAEVIFDGALEEGIVKDIPIIGTLLGIGKLSVGVRDSLLLRKIVSFISELNNIPPEKRRKVIEEIDASEKYRIRVGEKLLYIIDKCDDHEKSQLVAKLFAAFINGVMSYAQFLKGASALDHLLPSEIDKFIKEERDFVPLEEAGEYIASGLVVIYPPEISVEDQWDYKAGGKYIVEGNELFVSATDVGILVKQVLGNESSDEFAT